MRFNLARKQNRTISSKILSQLVSELAEEYDFQNQSGVLSYVGTGKQGLSFFVEWLGRKGFEAEMYYLLPNKDLFVDAGLHWQTISRTSPSFGFVIPDDDPKLVEYKLKYG